MHQSNTWERLINKVFRDFIGPWWRNFEDLGDHIPLPVLSAITACRKASDTREI